MRIDSIHIEGFGHFANRDFGPLDAPVTVLFGPNETGKSTILAFVRSVLFGFPTKLGAQHYPPLVGGRHGGLMNIADKNAKQYTLHRNQGSGGGLVTITDGCGETLDKSALGPLLGHHSQEVFKEVFAFTLDELHSEDLLKKDSVNSQIYSAGMGASRLPVALKGIQDKKNGLFRKRASTTKIAAIASELRDTKAKLKEVESNAERYGDLTNKYQQLVKESKELNEGRRQLLSKLEYQRQLGSIWDDWIDLVDTMESLARLPVITDFPDDGVNCLQSLEERMGKAQQEQESAANEVVEVQSRATAGIEHESILGHSATIQQLERGRRTFASAVRDLPNLNLELEGHERKLATTLQDIGSDWEENRLEDFDLSIIVREEILQFGNSLNKAGEEVERCSAELTQNAILLMEAIESEEDAKNDLVRMPMPRLKEEQAKKRRALIRTANSRLGELQSARERVTLIQDQLDSLASTSSPSRRKNDSIVSLVIHFLLGLAFLVGGIFLGGTALYLGIAACLLLIARAAFLLASSLKAGSVIESPQASSLRDSLAHAREKLEKLKSQIERSKTDLGLASIDQTSLIAAEESLANDESLIAETARRSKSLDNARELANRRKSKREQSEEGVSEAKARIEATQRDWEEWLKVRELHETFRPQNVIELQKTVELGLAQLNDVRSLQKRIDSIQKSISNYAGALEPLTSAYDVQCDMSVLGDVAAAADRLVELHGEVEECARERTASAEELLTAIRRLEERKGDTQEAYVEMRELLLSGDAGDVEEFRKREEVYRQREDLKNRHLKARDRLQRISGPGERLDDLQNTLRETDIHAIRDASREFEEQLNAIETLVRELDTTRGSIETELKTLTSEEESSKLRAKRSILVEQLYDLARDWAKYTLAERLLEEARRTFERERQPGVVRHAEAFFSEITDGRYDKVAAPLGQKTIRVAGADGFGKEPSTLSRGTREQLFLSLRFGLVRELGERTEPLPVIVDEVLVNFDPERALRAAKAFTELSHSNQVLVFTCHPTIVEHFQEAANQLKSPGPKVIQID